jgi:hypothetical protein
VRQAVLATRAAVCPDALHRAMPARALAPERTRAAARGGRSDGKPAQARARFALSDAGGSGIAVSAAA